MTDITIEPLNGENYIVNILRYEMELEADQIFVRNSPYVLPMSDGLFIAVGMITAQPFSNRTRTEPTDTGMRETQSVMMLENIQIDVFSRNDDASTRRWEVLAAISGVFSQQLQEKYNFKIFPISSSFVNTSETEGGDRLRKFSITIPLHVWYAKQKEIGKAYNENGDYYDEFQTIGEDSTTIADTTNIFDFTITE